MQTSYSLKQIISRNKGLSYELPNQAKLSVESELILTKPVRIQHPSDSILLPYIHSVGQVWSTSATGGSGVYTWSTEDPEIISVEGTVQINSKKISKTKLVVRDHRNLHNQDSIDVEVAMPTQLKWLQEQLELMGGSSSGSIGDQALLNVMAFDRQGRKFTNCTSL